MTVRDGIREPLQQWLEACLDAPSVEVLDLERSPSGQSSETFVFEAVAGDARLFRLVLRMQPSVGHLFPSPDAVLESRVIQGLEAAGGVAVPHVLGVEANPEVLGVPFFVMDLVTGQIPQGKPSLHTSGWLTALAPADRRRLWDSALDTVVAVHEVAWRQTHAFLDTGDRLDWLVRYYRWAAAGRSYPITDAAVAYLIDRRPPDTRAEPVLLWGDARVGNMIFRGDLTVAAALDWEVATIGPPEIDIAHWLFFDEFATDAVGIERLDGWPDRRSTVAEYEARSGRRLHHLEYFDVMQQLFMATTLIRQSDRRIALGRSDPDSRMGHDNTVTQMLARRVGLPVPELSADYAAHRGLPTSTGAAR
jgi:aminoglycoside phosphotransferase (APT) family kinase protein